MSGDLSMDRKEFARLCMIEMARAALLSQKKLPDENTQRAIAEDMARNLGMVPNSRVNELWAVARTNYYGMPDVTTLKKAWDNHMRPVVEPPTPKDAPRRELPSLTHDEEGLRHLAAVRTSRAAGGTMCVMPALKPEDWMLAPLAEPPTLAETRCMMRACITSTLDWYVANPHIAPYWGHYIKEYRLA